MATPAWRFEVEKTLEQRLERIEVHVEHIQEDVSELKARLTETDKRPTGSIDAVEQKLTGRIDALEQKLTGKLDAIVKALNDLNVGRAYDKVWFLLMSAALLAVLAKAFKWI